MKTYEINAVETIYHRWTIEAESIKEAIEIATEGCPDDTCRGETDHFRIKEIKP